MAKRMYETDMIGMQINDWQIISYEGDHKLKCRCSCGKIKLVSKYDLLNGTSTNCGHKRRDDITNKQFGEWKVIKYTGNNRYLCECSCGVRREVLKESLLIGRSTSCGHPRQIDINDLIGKKINEWEVLEYIGNYKYLCRCSCGKEKVVSRYGLLTGSSKSCGHGYNKLKDITNEQFGELTAKQYLGHGQWLCECSCGKKLIRKGKSLRLGESRSCGHLAIDTAQNQSIVKRTPEQKEAVMSAEKLKQFLDKFDYKLNMKELSKELGLTYPHTVKLINKFNLKNKIKPMSSSSYLEDELYKYIKDLIPNEEIERNVRIKMGDTKKELDILIPNRNIAIEFNGNYWHSNFEVGKNYHKNKTIECAKQGIRLIHIFEYEWTDINMQDKIKRYIADIFTTDTVIYARDCCVSEISTGEATIFCEQNHLQGYAKSSIKIGLRHNDELVSIITFGSPRFDLSTHEYEIVRLCSKSGYSIVGGTQKLFKYFLRNYNPESIITYTDISKFTGNIYPKIGFKVQDFTDPNYKWVSTDRNGDVLSRYQTQKHKLLEKGLGTSDQTEDEIMENLGYIKIYDAGNLRLVWERS